MDPQSSSGTEFIWLCGQGGFLRETLTAVLGKTFGKHRIYDARHAEPPALVLPSHIRWLFWFVNTPTRSISNLMPLTAQVPVKHLALISTDGTLHVRRSAHGELEASDLSLYDLIALVRATDHPLAPPAITDQIVLHN